MVSRQPMRSGSASNIPQPGAGSSSAASIGTLQQAPRRHHHHPQLQLQHQQPQLQQHHSYLHGSTARRLPGASSAISVASSAGASAHRSDSRLGATSADPAEDIIVRDERGEFRLEMPTMTPLPRDEAKEEQEMENRLIETYRKHHQQIEPAELKRTLQASLTAKAASLDRDAWMFDGNDDTPVDSP